uniref:Uncharacterized protein n=1 Tax=Pseudonaja textilis TaxID=8673 RepID=A0A670YUL1_PSETE
MDVRFYPAASGSSLPGDPSSLDFTQCLGYYSYNKVVISKSSLLVVVCLLFSISPCPLCKYNPL